MKRLLCITALMLLFSCQEKTYTIRGDTQGTTYTIKYNSLNSTISKHNIDSLLKLVDLSMSTYIDNSIISLINRGEYIILDSLLLKYKYPQVLNQILLFYVKAKECPYIRR